MPLKQQFALWALGQALPRAPALIPYLRSAFLAIMLAGFAGVVLALALAAIIAGAMLHLAPQFLHEGNLWLLGGGALLLFSLAGWKIAQQLLGSFSSMSSSLQLFEADGRDVAGETLNIMLNGAVEGFLDTPDEVKRERQESTLRH